MKMQIDLFQIKVPPTFAEMMASLAKREKTIIIQEERWAELQRIKDEMPTALGRTS